MLTRSLWRFCVLFVLLLGFIPAGSGLGAEEQTSAQQIGNRLTYLGESDPFYVRLDFPKLSTPQWVGQPGVDAVVVLAIDDLRSPTNYEKFLRPILNRLKEVEGTAPVSIMCNTLDPTQAQFQTWLQEGLSLEVHTLTHPCPLLGTSGFPYAVNTYHGMVDLQNQVPGSKPVAFRMPCCDSINSPSPRFYAELFNQVSPQGNFLALDSSVMDVLTPSDPVLPRALVVNADGQEKFRRYLPFRSFMTTIENYPYPYVIGKLCWEFPCVIPSDWEAQHIQGYNNRQTVEDWEATIEATVLKKGTFTLVFHPHNWIRNDQIVELVNFAVTKFGKRVKFLNFREAEKRLRDNLLAGQPIRAPNGQDNGVRLLDLNNDGYLDVVIANDHVRRTRVWQPETKSWFETSFPTPLVTVDAQGNHHDAGVRFGVLQTNGFASILVRNENTIGAWHFDGNEWVEDRDLWTGLETDGQPILTSREGHDRGVRLRDLNHDGRCELIVGNEKQSAVFEWDLQARIWRKLAYALPPGTAIVDAQGRDNGLRFVDVNEDGYADVLMSNEQGYSLHLYMPELYLGFAQGWSREIIVGARGTAGEIPRLVRGENHENNGAWFHSRTLWVQNENTALLPDLVDRRSFDELLGGLQPLPKSPQDSLAAIQVRPGFKVELVASEPMVKSPIGFDWGPDGKLWVVEMGDYPLGLDGQGKPGGIVRYLEDTDGDGKYDRSTVFLSGLNFPTGVMPWRNGVLISSAPEIIFAADTKGDGNVDVRKLLFTGFREGNQQHRVNGFEYGLDNWLYGANGESGGEVRSQITGKVVNLSGCDFRFRPDTGAFETVAGQTQYGRHRDDWGNWFGNNNSTWLWHYALPLHYLARNPQLGVRSTQQYLANYPDSTQVFPGHRLLQRFNDIGMVGHVTSGCSAIPYRDNLFGPDFASSVFICEPVHNLVHREVLEPEGVTFTSHRPPDESKSEFLTSSDNWFRPVMAKTGPDGALYIADMYRLIIEHPEWIPKDAQKVLNLRAGEDKGRIYRVTPLGATPRPVPRLDRLDTAGLVAAMDSTNGWQRDTAQRLLVCSASKSAAAPLEELLAKATNPKVRVQALCTLDGLGALRPEVLGSELKDVDPAVREHAVRITERFFNKREMKKLADLLLATADDSNLRVRYQLAFSLGDWTDPRAGQTLARLALRDTDNEPIQIAVLSSALQHLRQMLPALATAAPAQPAAATIEGKLLGFAAASSDKSALAQGLGDLAHGAGARPAAWRWVALAGFLDAVERRGGSLRTFVAEADSAVKKVAQELEPLFVQARATVDQLAQTGAGSHAPVSADWMAACRLLGRDTSGQGEDVDRLGRLLSPQFPEEVTGTAIGNLARLKSDHSADVLLSGWKGYSPTLRDAVTAALFTRPEWIEKFLAAVEQDRVAVGQVGQVQRQKLLTYNRDSIRERAAKLFSVTSPDRQKILADYKVVGTLQGDASKGAALFQQNCALCHLFHNQGKSVGPDLAMLTDKSTQIFVTAIMDPNQAVEARYLSYTAQTKSGQELSGIIAAESPSSITLRAANGLEEVILRDDLQELTASGLSLMPEGFEKILKPQDLADLIAYLKSP